MQSTTKKPTTKKPLEDKLINLQLTKKVAKTLLSQVEVSLDTTFYNESDFDEIYETYKVLKAKLSA